MFSCRILENITGSCRGFLPGNVQLNPLSPNSDENEISLYIITTCSNIQGIRIKEVIIKDECLDI